MKQFKLGGYYGALGASTSPGAGITWKQSVDSAMDARFSVSTSYNSSNGTKSNPNSGGIGTNNAASRWNTQIAYGNPQWNISAIYRYSTAKGAKGYSTPASLSYDTANQFALRGWWQPKKSGFIPSFSVGWGLSDFNDRDNKAGGTKQSWFVGMNWKDAFIKGNLLGFAIAQPEFITSTDAAGDPDDGNYAMELYYQFQVTDNISVTPAVFYLSRPYGEKTGTSASYGGTNADSFSIFGYLVKTTFRF